MSSRLTWNSNNSLAAALSKYWIYGCMTELVFRYISGPRWIPHSARQHTRCLFLRGVTTSGGSGKPSASRTISVARWTISQFFPVWMCPFRMSRSRSWVETIEPWEWVAMKITSALFVDKRVRFNKREEVDQRTGANPPPKSRWTENQGRAY